jgi:hypothetical protein
LGNCTICINCRFATRWADSFHRCHLQKTAEDTRLEKSGFATWYELYRSPGSTCNRPCDIAGGSPCQDRGSSKISAGARLVAQSRALADAGRTNAATCGCGASTGGENSRASLSQDIPPCSPGSWLPKGFYQAHSMKQIAPTRINAALLGSGRRQGLCCAELAKRSAPTLMSRSPVGRAWPISCSPVFSASLAGTPSRSEPRA